jgi:hypothetical protein
MLKLGIVACVVSLACIGVADAAPKKKPLKRADFTAAEQAKIYKEGLATCRKQYGPLVERVVVDYRKRRYVCWVR